MSCEAPKIIRVGLDCPPDLRREWVTMRSELWDHGSEALDRQLTSLSSAGVSYVGFLAKAGDGQMVGFAEAALRPYVNGCDTSPVVFLEGIYVRPNFRRKGIARLLTAEVESWGREVGCAELGSDARMENLNSHAMHKALGFEETSRVVYFRKKLG